MTIAMRRWKMKIVKVEDEDGNGDLKEEEADNCVPAMLSPDSLPLPRPANSSKTLSLE